MQKTSPITWFITGTSQGFGLELVRAALARGDKVIATSRTPEKIQAVFPNSAEQLLVLSVDLTSDVSVQEAVSTAIAQFGHIDVLVNNAGHGLLGAIQEVNAKEMEKLFQLNLFSLIRITQVFLPHFRERKSGHIVNFSSIAGLTVLSTGLRIYNATKFAVEGLSQALAQEVAPFGIRVTIVEPGRFRTNFLGDSMVTSSKFIDAYLSLHEKFSTQRKSGHRSQPGDPALGAAAIIQAVTSEHPPLHLLLGSDAYDAAIKQVDALKNEVIVQHAGTEAAVGVRS